mgnify:CR=1 FL=1
MVEAMQLDIFKMVMENLNLLIFVAGVICFLTVVITQVTKRTAGTAQHPDRFTGSGAVCGVYPGGVLCLCGYDGLPGDMVLCHCHDRDRICPGAGGNKRLDLCGRSVLEIPAQGG